MRRLLIMAAASALILSGALLIAGCGPVVQQRPQDTRERLALTPMERGKVLSEMRLMLESVNGITQGIADDDLLIIERSARGAGGGIAADLDPALTNRLPENFRQLGMRTHKSFDNLADQVRAGRSSEEALKGLVEITGNCVGCHASYKIVEGYPPISRFGPPPNL